MSYCQNLDLFYIEVQVYSQNLLITKKVKWPITGPLVFLDEYL